MLCRGHPRDRSRSGGCYAGRSALFKPHTLLWCRRSKACPMVGPSGKSPGQGVPEAPLPHRRRRLCSIARSASAPVSDLAAHTWLYWRCLSGLHVGWFAMAAQEQLARGEPPASAPGGSPVGGARPFPGLVPVRPGPAPGWGPASGGPGAVPRPPLPGQGRGSGPFPPRVSSPGRWGNVLGRRQSDRASQACSRSRDPPRAGPFPQRFRVLALRGGGCSARVSRPGRAPARPLRGAVRAG